MDQNVVVLMIVLGVAGVPLICAIILVPIHARRDVRRQEEYNSHIHHIKCSNCKEWCDKETIFCNCGLKIAGPCPNCNGELEGKSTRCHHCGYYLMQQGIAGAPPPITGIVISEEDM